jgi:hypothetical protein
MMNMPARGPYAAQPARPCSGGEHEIATPPILIAHALDVGLVVLQGEGTGVLDELGLPNSVAPAKAPRRSISDGGATTQPMRQPLMACDLDRPSIITMLSRQSALARAE